MEKQRFSAFADALTSDIDSHLNSVISDERRYTLNRLKGRFRKKFSSSDIELSKQALKDFLALNEQVGLNKVSLDPFILENARHFIVLAFEKYSRKLDPDNIQVSFVRSKLLDNWRFGPGASHLVKGTHTAEKIYEPMTTTTLAEPLVTTLRSQHTYMKLFDEIQGTGVTLVEGSKMSTVPKNESVARTIAIEPSGNMALQLAAGRYIEDVLRCIGLDIKSQQTVNRDLAKEASMTGRLATLDLKSASDMIKPALCKALLPPDVYRFLMRIRSPRTKVGDNWFDLNMISTMGNGFTFPLMTLIILSICYSVALKKGGPFNYVDYRFISVFGDDIIVPTFISEDVIIALEQAGLVVNKDKSYLSGLFRESCGGDYINGYNCTPIYVKALRTNSDVYVAINQVLQFCGEHNFVFSAALKLLSSFIDGPLLYVPEWHNDTDGVRTTLVSRRYKHLSLKQKYVRLRDEHYLMPLACGGYILRRGDSNFFVPRPRQPRYIVRKSRLPNGFLDGRSVEKRSDRVSSFIDSWLFLLE